MITMTRRVTFAAAVAEWSPNLSRAENEARYGVKASPEPFGHNYTLDVAVRGAIDPKTGMVVNIKIIDKIVREQVVEVLDRKFINRQAELFFNQVPTAETLTEFIASQLAPAMPPEVRLTGIRLESDPNHWAHWQAGESSKEQTMQVTHVYEFSASHRLHSPHLSDEENREVFGKCNYENGHGHNYILEVTISGPTDRRTGRILDPDTLDQIVEREVVSRYDHRHLNYDLPEFEGLVPSAEVIAKVIWERLRPQFAAPARLHRVLLRETARNIFEYRGEEEF